MAENDPKVWKAWYEEHGARLLLYSRQQTRSGADAEDVLQDAFVRMWKTAEKEPSLGLPNLPFAYTSVRRCAIDHARKTDRRKNREDRVQQDAPQEVWFESDIESREQREIIQESLKKLPPQYQEVLSLKIWGEMTFAAIAELQDISINTVASRYRYALQALKKHFHAEPLLER